MPKERKNVMFPLEEVKKNAEDIIILMSDVTTVEKCKEAEKQHGLTITINGHPLNFYESSGFTDEDIMSIRVEAYENLGYIYFRKAQDAMFDIWCEEIDDYIVEDVTLETLEIKYREALAYLELLEKEKHLSEEEKKQKLLKSYMEKLETSLRKEAKYEEAGNDEEVRIQRSATCTYMCWIESVCKDKYEAFKKVQEVYSKVKSA